jgi:4-hydroxybenzoate polyprenyltransferase
MGRLRDLLLLVRAPLAATAIADVVAGSVLARPSVEPRTVALLAGASCALYWAGMALNDLFDRERDLKLAPHRPLPSGRLSAGAGAAIGFGLLATGLFLGALAGSLAGAAAVAVAVLLYDALLKRARLPGAIGMALCRGANVLMGAAAAGDVLVPGPAHAHAAAIAGYVFALTLLSTFEDEDADRAGLFVGFGTAIAIVAAYGAVLPDGLSWLALAPLLLLVVTRFGDGLRRGTKASGKTTTRWLIRGLLLLDAGALLGTSHPGWALGVVALAVPYLGGARLLMGAPPKPAGAS